MNEFRSRMKLVDVTSLISHAIISDTSLSAVEIHSVVREHHSHIFRERACNALCSPFLLHPPATVGMRTASRILRIHSFPPQCGTCTGRAIEGSILPPSPRDLTTRGN